jgi:hypothetical protein
LDQSFNTTRSTAATYGKYRVEYDPLSHMPYGLYRIYVASRCIGAQLSWVTESDCRWHEAQQGMYATQSESAQRQPPMHAKEWRERRGRKSNAERARLAALKDEEPVF